MDSPAIDLDPRQKSTGNAGKVQFLTLAHLDRRTAASRRVQSIVAALESDLGGSDQLSEGERQLIQRAAVLGAFIEHCEASWLKDEVVPLSDYLAAINAQRRVLTTIGLKRVARDVTPTLHQYLQARKESSNDDTDTEARRVDAVAPGEQAAARTEQGAGRGGGSNDDRRSGGQGSREGDAEGRAPLTDAATPLDDEEDAA